MDCIIKKEIKSYEVEIYGKSVLHIHINQKNKDTENISYKRYKNQLISLDYLKKTKEFENDKNFQQYQDFSFINKNNDMDIEESGNNLILTIGIPHTNSIKLFFELLNVKYYLAYGPKHKRKNNNKPFYSSLNSKIVELETKLEKMGKEVVTKKIGVAFISPNLFGNGIGRLITILTELLIKTGRYDVYLINEQSTEYDFKYHKKIKREIQKKEEQIIRDFDEANDIQIYVLNNDVSYIVDIYQSLGKKVIGIFHGVYLSCVFINNPDIYRAWHLFSKFDSFIHIIPDDYWIYKDRFGFNNSVFIPNLYTFDKNKTPSSNLTYKNVLMVGRFDETIKGGKYGIYAMAEILKEVPDAKLTVVIPSQPNYIIDLVKQ